MLEVANNIAKKSPVDFIIKLHPADQRKGFYEAWVVANKLRRHVSVVQKYDPLILARGVDFLIVHRSTYAVDGFALNKRVICYRSESDRLLEEFKRFGVFHFASSKRDLWNTVNSFVENRGITLEHSKEAKEECLNENGFNPEDLIASALINAKT